MPSGVVTLGRHTYASGLYWENSPSGFVSQAAKEAARQPGHRASLYAIRPGNTRTGRVPQFALSQDTPDHHIGMPSLAGCLANEQPGSWVGAFQFREGVAVVIVRDDLVVPDGDIFFESASDARDRLLQEIALGGRLKIYAPESWGVQGSDSIPISLLLRDRSDVRLRPVEIPRSWFIALGVSAVALAAILMISWILQRMSAAEEAERRAQMLELERARRAAQQMIPQLVQKPPEYPPPQRVWEQKPLPLEFVESCQNTLSKVPLATAAWRMTSIGCVGSSLTVRWGRSGGFSLPPPGAFVSETGSVATLVLPLQESKPRGKEDLWSPTALTRRILVQNWPGTIGRALDDPKPLPPPDYKGPWDPPAPPWMKRSFSFSFAALPWVLPTLFEGLPGLIVESLVADGPSGPWTVEGVIYENRS